LARRARSAGDTSSIFSRGAAASAPALAAAAAAFNLDCASER
jgi:hypothetical protein